jgi:nucleotide-binding universal stress UspA family protein
MIYGYILITSNMRQIRRVSLIRPVSTIINYALDKFIDLIVLGTKGTIGLKVLLGSIANGVVKHVHCPIFVVIEFVGLC